MSAAPIEVELKLVASPQTLEQVACDHQLEAARSTPWRRDQLDAVYYDSPDHRLLTAGLVFRLREVTRADGARSTVATLKSRGRPTGTAGLSARREWEQTVPAGSTPGARLFDDATPRGLIEAALAGSTCVPLFATRVERRHSHLRFRNAVIEVALDRGVVDAGAGRVEDLAEVELELIDGPTEPVLALGRALSTRYALHPSDESKFARGLRLAGLR